MTIKCYLKTFFAISKYSLASFLLIKGYSEIFMDMIDFIFVVSDNMCIWINKIIYDLKSIIF